MLFNAFVVHAVTKSTPGHTDVRDILVLWRRASIGLGFGLSW